MILIIKKISATTNVRQVEQFLEPAVRGGLFNRKGVLESIEIKMFKQSDVNVPEYHAIVRIEPENVATRVIQKLNRKVCDGKPVSVCQYHVRYRTNDRRDAIGAVRVDRRMVDRRRKNLEITDVTNLKMGVHSLHRAVAEKIALSTNPFENAFKI